MACGISMARDQTGATTMTIPESLSPEPPGNSGVGSFCSPSPTLADGPLSLCLHMFGPSVPACVPISSSAPLPHLCSCSWRPQHPKAASSQMPSGVSLPSHTVLSAEKEACPQPHPVPYLHPLSPVPCRTPPSNHSLCLELLQSSLHRAQAKATREISQCPESSSHSDSSGRSTRLPANQLMQIGVRPPPTPTRGTIKGIHNPGSNHLKSSWSLQEHCEFLGGRNLSYSFLPVPCTVCWVCLRTST